MPTYKVTDPETGRTIRLTGDSPPTEQELEEVFSRFQVAEEEPSRLEAGLRGGASGISFGLDDEIAGLIGAIGEGTYEKARDDYRARSREAETAHPMTYKASEFGSGILVPGLGGARLAQNAAKGVSALRSYGAVAGAGAAEGAIAGAGHSEAETAGGVARDALTGSALGAVAAPTLTKGFNMAGGAAATLGGGISRRLAQTPEDVARLRVSRAMRDDGITDPEALARQMREAGPGARLADMGDNLRQEAVVASKVPGAGRRIANDFVDARQQGQEARLRRAARQAMETTWSDFPSFQKTVGAEMKSKAGPLYERAYARGIEVTPEMRALAQKPAIKEAAKRAMVNVKNKADAGAGARELTDDGLMSTQFMDQVLRELKDRADVAYRSGAGEEASDLWALRAQLRDEVFRQNPDLEAAMGVWRGGSALKSAADYGRQIMGKKVRLDELEEAMLDFSASEGEAFRVGLLQGIYDRLEDAATNQNSASRLVNSSRVNKILRQGFKDKDSYRKFMRVVDDEMEFQKTRNAVAGGSPTMQLQEARRGGVPYGPGAMGQVSLWIQHLFQRLGAEEADISRLKPEDYEEVSKLLFGKVDEETLQAIVAPTLRIRMSDRGVLDTASAAAGLSASNMTAETATDLSEAQ